MNLHIAQMAFHLLKVLLKERLVQCQIKKKKEKKEAIMDRMMNFFREINLSLFEFYNF